MPTLSLTTSIAAPASACFALSLTVDAHTASMGRSGERAVAGRTSGVLTAGEHVTWRARHFGLPFEMSVVVSEHDPPRRFVDEQTRGPFAHWRHEHLFVEDPAGHTTMHDEIDFASPLGPAGRVVDRLVLTGYLHRLVATRNTWLRATLEAG